MGTSYSRKVYNEKKFCAVGYSSDVMLFISSQTRNKHRNSYMLKQSKIKLSYKIQLNQWSAQHISITNKFKFGSYEYYIQPSLKKYLINVYYPFAIVPGMSSFVCCCRNHIGVDLLIFFYPMGRWSPYIFTLRIMSIIYSCTSIISSTF